MLRTHTCLSSTSESCKSPRRTSQQSPATSPWSNQIVGRLRSDLILWVEDQLSIAGQWNSRQSKLSEGAGVLVSPLFTGASTTLHRLQYSRNICQTQRCKKRWTWWTTSCYFSPICAHVLPQIRLYSEFWRIAQILSIFLRFFANFSQAEGTFVLSVWLNLPKVGQLVSYCYCFIIIWWPQEHTGVFVSRLVPGGNSQRAGNSTEAMFSWNLIIIRSQELQN